MAAASPMAPMPPFEFKRGGGQSTSSKYRTDREYGRQGNRARRGAGRGTSRRVRYRRTCSSRHREQEQ